MSICDLVPRDNVVDLSFAGTNGGLAEVMEGFVYAPNSKFQGVFIDDDESPEWARRAARWLEDEFLYDTPGTKKMLGDILSELADDGAGKVLMNCRYALEAWEALPPDKRGQKPYTASQRYGSCVDASCAEHEDTLFAVRAFAPQMLPPDRRPAQPEAWKHSSGWYKYADRGYCGDGWNGSGIASVARRVGAAFRIKYGSGNQSVDFREDNENEYVVARKWCQRGIPSWMSDITSFAHAYEDGAITRFEGGVYEMRRVFAAGGVLHTSGRRTSGGSKPFMIGSVGPHMQSGVGCDDSDDFRQFCQDVLNVTPRDNDFPVAMNQTWSDELGQWRGECDPQYWPSWWGPQPVGAWVWWASDVLTRLDIDSAWMPWVKGFPADPTPIPGPQPNLSGELHAEQAGSGIAIRGVLTDDRGNRYIAIPKSNTPGVYVMDSYPDL